MNAEQTDQLTRQDCERGSGIQASRSGRKRTAKSGPQIFVDLIGLTRNCILSRIDGCFWMVIACIMLTRVPGCSGLSLRSPRGRMELHLQVPYPTVEERVSMRGTRPSRLRSFRSSGRLPLHPTRAGRCTGAVCGSSRLAEDCRLGE